MTLFSQHLLENFTSFPLHSTDTVTSLSNCQVVCQARQNIKLYKNQFSSSQTFTGRFEPYISHQDTRWAKLVKPVRNQKKTHFKPKKMKRFSHIFHENPVQRLHAKCVFSVDLEKQESQLINVLHTYEQLAVELKMNVSISRGFLDRSGVMVHIQRGFFYVPLGSHVMPPVVVQSHGRLHLHLQRTVPHVEREDNFGWRCEEKQTFDWWISQRLIDITVNMEMIQLERSKLN